jgi:hypothetical protein
LSTFHRLCQFTRGRKAKRPTCNPIRPAEEFIPRIVGIRMSAPLAIFEGTWLGTHCGSCFSTELFSWTGLTLTLFGDIDILQNVLTVRVVRKVEKVLTVKCTGSGSGFVAAKIRPWGKERSDDEMGSYRVSERHQPRPFACIGVSYQSKTGGEVD